MITKLLKNPSRFAEDMESGNDLWQEDEDEEKNRIDAFDRLFMIKEGMSPDEIEESRQTLNWIRTRVQEHTRAIGSQIMEQQSLELLLQNKQLAEPKLSSTGKRKFDAFCQPQTEERLAPFSAFQTDSRAPSKEKCRHVVVLPSVMFRCRDKRIYPLKVLLTSAPQASARAVASR